MHITGISAALACAAALATHASAQTTPPRQSGTYPVKPIRMIIPYPAGGTSDILARLIGARITENWGQQVVADTRTGANGNIAAEIVARSAPDGYTLMLTDVGNLSISPSLYKLPFDINRDFTTITTVSYSPHLLATHPSVPVKAVRDLIALARSNPGKLNYPTGLGGAPHLAGMMFEQRTGIKWTYIGTRGGSQSVQAILTGEGDVLFLGMLQTLPHVKNGRLKLLAVSSEKRHPSLPEVPTVAESQGLAGFVTGSWQGIVGPARIPADVVTRLHAELVRILSLPDMKEKLSSQGADPVGNSPQDTAKWLAAESERWGKLIRETGFKID